MTSNSTHKSYKIERWGDGQAGKYEERKKRGKRREVEGKGGEGRRGKRKLILSSPAIAMWPLSCFHCEHSDSLGQ